MDAPSPHTPGQISTPLRDSSAGSIDPNLHSPSQTRQSNTGDGLYEIQDPGSSQAETPRRAPGQVTNWSARSQSQSQRIPVTDHRPYDADHGTNTFSLDRPMRSIFSSPQPTSSVSVNTAHASMSIAAGSFSSTGAAFRSLGQSSESTSLQSTQPQDYSIPGTEKELDDPTSSAALLSELNLSATSQALASLFVTSDSHASGVLSRRTTQGPNLPVQQRLLSDTASLAGHLYHSGFREGRHSDITIQAFGQEYKLHKLILERLPFFSSAFSERWSDNDVRVMTLEPDDIDPNITKSSFELAMRRIYGTIKAEEEEEQAVALFATACWLDMTDLVETCIDTLLRQMTSENVQKIIRLVTQNCYGKPGDRILASAKAMLCRDGWEMPYEFWDDIPAEIIRDVVSGDPFYVPSEWERWFLTVRLLNRRLRQIALAENMISPAGFYLLQRPRYLTQHAIRVTKAANSWNQNDPWRALYAHPEIVPLVQLLDTGIHYMHLRFEQLQQLKLHRDIFRVPLLPDKVISDALWMSMELRQRIVNAREGDLELDLTDTASSEHPQENMLHFPQVSEVREGKQRKTTDEDSSDHSSDHSLHLDMRPRRRFRIPNTDISCVMGGSSEAYATASLTAPTDVSHRSQSITGTFEPSDVAWPPDLGGSIFDSHSPLSRNISSHNPPRFSSYPPFRFCAEFPNPRTLKDKKRVYSQTVWYAGSMWNLYIQRVNTTKSQQLGIYLHRAKDKESSGDPLALTVDDRIGQLEREMLLRKGERRHRYWRTEQLMSSTDVEDDASADGSTPINSSTDINITAGSSSEAHTRDSNTSASSRVLKTSQLSPRNHLQQQNSAHSSSSRSTFKRSSSTVSDSETIPMTDDDPETELALLRSASKQSISAIPPYVDTRPTINTYYKIYSPSKGGRLLSVYESAPDSFDFGKSWGWRSCQMVLDDGVGDSLHGKDNKLRYMVVLGNV